MFKINILQLQESRRAFGPRSGAGVSGIRCAASGDIAQKLAPLCVKNQSGK